MAGMLLLNPRRRRRASKARAANPRRKVRASKRRANPILNPKRRARAANPRRRRRNPFPAMLAANPRRRRRVARRANPMRRRRHRNPLGISTGGLMGMLKGAAIGAVGAIGMDFVWGQVNTYLPASLQTNASTVGAGDAVKLLGTVALGLGLDKMTKGMSRKAAEGALVVQLYDLINAQLPASAQASVAGLGWFQPTAVVNGQNWIGPNKRRPGASMGTLLRPGGRSPLLNGMGTLLRPGGRSPLLSGRSQGGPGMPMIGATLVSGAHGLSR